MPHLHLSLQAGDDLILEAHEAPPPAPPTPPAPSPAPARCARTSPFGADLIAGFPTETEAMFAQHARAVVEDSDLTFLHVFPYQRRARHAGRAHARRCPSAERQRARRPPARRRRRPRVRRFLAGLVGQHASVLAERDDRGHSERFAPVRA
jgi:threonylcarbamoyladenosine tRNA methylthiotransferase MtaB